MKKKLLSKLLIAAVLLVAIALTFGIKANAEKNSQNLVFGNCSQDTSYNNLTNKCEPLSNELNKFSSFAKGINVPNLQALRKGRVPKSIRSNIPVPGGIGSGVIYNVNKFKITSSANLQTKMIIYPQGLDVNLPANWIFTTATNRSEKGVEVVGIYNGSTSPSLGIFDWSCSATDPCTNPDGTQGTDPSWQRIIPVAQLSCNYSMDSAGGGNQIENMMYYNNATYKKMPTINSIPAWNNDVQLWNYCNRRWDLIYSHTYKGSQKDCSLDNSCGWWGPIIETFFDSPQPPINEVGFAASSLTIDNLRSILDNTNTSWVQPLPNWKTFFLIPNSSWAAGSYAANLTISAQVSPNPQKINKAVSYNITAKNIGVAGASNVVVAVYLPAGFSFSQLTTSQGFCLKSSVTQASCRLGTLLPGKNVATTLVGTYKNPATYNLIATIDPYNVVAESNKSDNVASASLTITN